ncbi:MAG: LysM peptidoglycan-binding domain-containing protein [Candidatus Nomurabacteria bacterium]|jgi:surface antigen/LysM repeat protein|nr:LysM peptidoglycan-binding domain-containing protein [Candidatus Nomurabacteria bacterium]
MRKFKAKFSKYSIIYPLIFIGVVGVLASGYISPSEALFKGSDSDGTIATVMPTASHVKNVSANEVSVADMAISVAEISSLSVHNQAITNASSIRIKEQLAQVEETSVSKNVTAATNSRAFVNYTVVEGDSTTTIMDKFSRMVSEQTIRWANGLKSTEVTAGAVLTIPVVDGVVYTVSEGDTMASIVEKYGSSADLITYYNDDITGDVLPVGLRILLPAGNLPEQERPEYEAPLPNRSTSTGGSSGFIAYSSGPMMAGNRYSYGYCTYYAYNRRVQLGLPVGSFWGNASTWSSYARASGLLVDNVPASGAIFQYGGGYGHVGIVESIDWASGTMYVSDMNGFAGWNRVGYATVPINYGWSYIH